MKTPFILLARRWPLTAACMKHLNAACRRHRGAAILVHDTPRPPISSPKGCACINTTILQANLHKHFTKLLRDHLTVTLTSARSHGARLQYTKLWLKLAIKSKDVAVVVLADDAPEAVSNGSVGSESARRHQCERVRYASNPVYLPGTTTLRHFEDGRKLGCSCGGLCETSVSA
jgi:hypothetical protein